MATRSSVSSRTGHGARRCGLFRGLHPQLDRLGQDGLLLGVEEGNLADLLEVHADGVVDADHVGRQRLELLGRRLLELLGVDLGRIENGELLYLTTFQVKFAFLTPPYVTVGREALLE